jgi:catechol 2,3-dioxygenase-like lactoylglutathione lyase family enzyme
MGVWVADLDAVLVRLEARGTHFVSEPNAHEGGRRICVRDPNGVYLELMEDKILLPPKEENRVSARDHTIRTQTLTLSVPHLEQAERYFEGLLGMERVDGTLHTPEMEGMWGLEGAETRTTLLGCDQFLLELVEYLSPRGKARPSDEQIGDAGIWHFALWFRKGRYVKRAYREACRAGHSSYSTPLNLGLVSAVYMKTDQGFSVEYFYAPRLAARLFGFLS